jgi:hypothetical protein
MKKFLTKLVFVAVLFLTTSTFFSCDSSPSKKENKTTIIADKKIPITAGIKEISYQEPIVFIAGYDEGSDHFYSNARTYFEEKGIRIVDGKYSLEEIIIWLNSNGNQEPYSEVHIVNKSNPYKSMNLETIVRGAKITAETLEKTIREGTMPKLKNVVNNNSKIIFHAAGLSTDKLLITALKNAFHAIESPKIIASPYHSIFGGKFSNYYLAQSYYVFYPTAHSTGKVDLSKEIEKKYPKVKDIDWYAALNNEEERYLGEAYTTQFAIPIKWEFDYFNSDNEMPKFTTAEEVMDWIETQDELVTELEKYNVPIEKFRWNWSVKGTLLVIRGRTTGLCVLRPLTKPYGDLEHIKPDTNNKRLYAIK